jgi:hypothetical protein
MSKGAKKLLEIVKTIYPNQRMILEYHLGDRLYLDIYMPHLGIALEYDGSQHTSYSEHFHKNAAGFRDSIKRDMHKAEICTEQHITLINISYHDPITVEFVRNKIIEGLNGE